MYSTSWYCFLASAGLPALVYMSPSSATYMGMGTTAMALW